MSQLVPDSLIHYDRYRIVRDLGEGGFGKVYEAIDTRLNRRVALKQLILINERVSRQFMHEAHLLANLNHPALPRVTDYFSDPVGQFLVMDYIQGHDLGTQIEERKAAFPVDTVMTWADQLLDVLQYLHSHNPPIIHRDVKPQNIKLQTDGRLVLLDFGLAKGHAGIEPVQKAQTMFAYTRNFSPPEQIEGRPTDPRSDVYAVGATLYYLLTNKQTAQATFRKVGDLVVPAHRINAAIPAAIGDVIHQALALEPEQRPASAAEMREMLQRARQTGVNRTVSHEPPKNTTTDRQSPPQQQPAQPSNVLTPIQPRIVVQRSDGTVYTSQDVRSSQIRVGRGPDNDIVLPETNISSRHLEIHWDGQRASIIDQQSTNGTWLGNQRVAAFQRTEWSPTTSIRIGSLWLWFILPSSSAEPSPQATAQGSAGHNDRSVNQSPVRLLKEMSTVMASDAGDTSNSFQALKHQQEVHCVAFSPDGQMLASATQDGVIALWHLGTGSRIGMTQSKNAMVRSLAFSPDGRVLALTSQNMIQLWSVPGMTPIRALVGHTNATLSVAFSPDGRQIASGAFDYTVKLWDSTTGKLIGSWGPTLDGVAAVSFSPEQQMLAATSYDTVTLWHLGTRAAARTLQGHTAEVSSVAFSPNGQYLATGSYDRFVKVWRLSDGACMRTFFGHTDVVRSVAFAPDGATLASGGSDKTVRLWQLTDQGIDATLGGHDDWVRSVAFAPHGRTLASASSDGTVRLWSINRDG